MHDLRNGKEMQHDSDSDDNEPSRPDDPVRKALECKSHRGGFR